MALKGRGVRDTARVLGIGTGTVLAEVKKAAEVVTVNPFTGSPQSAVEIPIAKRACARS